MTEVTLIDYQIDNLDTFQTATVENPRQLAGLYFFMVLDRLVSTAEWLSHDFFKRPEKYSGLDSKDVKLLARLHAKIGSDEQIPSQKQRDEIFVPIFGPADGSSANFPSLRGQLMESAANFVQRHADDGVDALIKAFRSALRKFNEYLDNKHGATVEWSRHPVLSNITESIAYPILRSDRVAFAWGFTTSPSNDWPYQDESRASREIDEMFGYFSQQQMQPQPNGSGAATSMTYSSQQQIQSQAGGSGAPTGVGSFADLQELARRGAEAIATCIDVSPNSSDDAQIRTLIAQVFTWREAYMALYPHMQPA